MSAAVSPDNLIVVPLEIASQRALKMAMQSGCVRLGLDHGVGRAVLYVRTATSELLCVGYAKSPEMVNHLRAGKDAYARLNESITDDFSITCTLLG